MRPIALAIASGQTNRPCQSIPAMPMRSSTSGAPTSKCEGIRKLSSITSQFWHSRRTNLLCWRCLDTSMLLPGGRRQRVRSSRSCSS